MYEFQHKPIEKDLEGMIDFPFEPITEKQQKLYMTHRGQQSNTYKERRHARQIQKANRKPNRDRGYKR